MNDILAAILSNLSYAFADNANGLVAKKNSALKIATWVSLFGLVVFSVPMLIFFQDEIARLSVVNVAWILGAGLIVALGYLSFVMGMTKGSVTLTGVIGGSFPAVTTLTALLFFGERVSLLQACAISAVLIGVALSALEGDARNLIRDIKSSALVYAFGAFFLWGIYFALVRIPVEQVGWFLPQYGSIVVGFPLYFYLARRSGEKAVLSTWPKLPALILLIAVLQVCGSALYNVAISTGDTSIVAPIAGSSPAIFVVLAFFIFREKLKWLQVAGIVTTVVGIVGLSLL